MPNVSILEDFFESTYLKHFIWISTLKSEHILIWHSLEKCEHCLAFHTSNCLCTYFNTEQNYISIYNRRCNSASAESPALSLFTCSRYMARQSFCMSHSHRWFSMYEVSDLEVQREFCSRITDRDGASDEQLRWGVWVVALPETADTIHKDTGFSIS